MLPPYAVEVAVTGQVDAPRIAAVDVHPGCGPQKFDFPPATFVGCSLSSPVGTPVAMSSTQDGSQALIWELDAAEPAALTLRRFAVAGAVAAEDDVAVLRFPAPLLPSIASAETNAGTSVFALSADGALHVISHERSPPAGAAPPLAETLAEALRSVPLASAFDRLGAPTALAHVEGTLCIGTAAGSVLCLPAADPSLDAAFELSAGSGLLGGLLGGLFRGTGPQAVQRMVELSSMERSLLCTLHAGAAMKLWDLSMRRLIHSCDLLPPEEAAGHRAALARVALEPLDATCSILLVYYEPEDPESEEPGVLSTFELFIEDRGGSTKVLLEGGPRLAGGIHRLADMAVQHVGTHSIGAWMLYDDEAGVRRMHCVPLAFTDGAVRAAVEVALTEEQVEAAAPAPEDSAGVGTLASLAAALESALPDALRGGFHPADAFADSLFAPGRLCRPALQTALQNVGWAAGLAGEAIAAEAGALRNACGAAARAAPVGPVAAWTELVEAYAAALRDRHAPLALVQLNSDQDEGQGLLLVRSGGALSLVRHAEAPELVAAGAWPAIWENQRDVDVAGAKSALQAAASVSDVTGGAAGAALVAACVRQGASLEADLLPAIVAWVLGGRGPEEWRAACRALPLTLGTLCAAPANGFAAALEAVTALLGQSHAAHTMVRSPLETFSAPLVAASLSQAHQVATAQWDCLLRLRLLAEYVATHHTLGLWTLSEGERQRVVAVIVDRLRWMLAAAGVALWASAAPVARRGDAEGADAAASSLVVSLRITGDASGTPNKRARLTPAPAATGAAGTAAYPAEHLLASFKQSAHAVRDLHDLRRVAAAFSSWILCVPEVPDVDLHRQGPSPAVGTLHALDMAPALIRTRSIEALHQLLAIAGGLDPQDPRFVFVSGAVRALTLAAGGLSPDRTAALEREAVALFFRVAATFSVRAYFREQLDTVAALLEALRGPEGAAAEPVVPPADAHEDVLAAAEELNFYESLMGVFERAGCASAASRFAAAAVRHVDNALPGPALTGERVARTGRLWSAVFSFCLEAREYSAAYAALLGNEAAEMQADCVHQLVNEMVDRGEVAALCSLPFAHRSLVVRGREPRWVSLLDEAVIALRRRAANSDVNDAAQPYQVLFDFHAARGNYQAAAAAALAHARRLAAEAPEDRAAAEAAQRALAAAVSALGLVDPDQAWLDDPGRARPAALASASADADAAAPAPVVTLEDLRKEHALANARAAVSAALPQGEMGAERAPQVFHQLLALGLYDEAFDLADAFFIGNKQQRMRERATAEMAAAAARLQLAIGISGSRRGEAAEDDEVSMDEGDGPESNEYGAEADAEDPVSREGAAAAAAAAAWRRLRQRLEGYEAAGAAGYCLRVIAVDAILGAHRGMRAPLWLLVPFTPPPALTPLASTMPTADTAGLIRVYMKHGRLEGAAILGIKLLGRVADAVPSVALPRPAAVCLPHALLEELAGRLAHGNPLRQDLESQLKKVQAAAARQTEVLAEIYRED